MSFISNLGSHLVLEDIDSTLAAVPLPFQGRKKSGAVRRAPDNGDCAADFIVV